MYRSWLVPAFSAQVWFACRFPFWRGEIWEWDAGSALSFTAHWQVYLSRTHMSLPIKWHVNPGRVENCYFGGLGADINPAWKSLHLLPSFPSSTDPLWCLTQRAGHTTCMKMCRMINQEFLQPQGHQEIIFIMWDIYILKKRLLCII